MVAVSMAVVGAFAVQTFIAGAAGDESGDSYLVAVTPCRLADTRPTEQIGPNTTFGTNDTETFQATGTNGQCTIPEYAVGLSLNVTAVNATLPTHLTIWPDGDKPNASSLNPEPGQVAVNAVTAMLSTSGSYRVYNLQGSVNVIIDVNGYYTPAFPPAFTASAFDGGMLFFGPQATEVIATDLTAPGDGKVTVMASFYLSHMGGADVTAHCSITTGTSVEEYHDVYQSSDPYGPVTIVRVYDVTSLSEATYRLVCEHWPTDQGSPFASNRNIVATYTAAA